MERPTQASSEGNRKSMQANKGRDTKPELALRRAVHALGLRYRVSVRPLPAIRRTADLVFTRAKVAVFMDGCFWHGCPQHHSKPATNSMYWAEKVRRNRERDAETDRTLAEAGWSVIRIWEHEDPSTSAQMIADRVRQELTVPFTASKAVHAVQQSGQPRP
ncbi:very short patch repair endonuclease [Nonomuraea sp. NPDC001684]